MRPSLRNIKTLLILLAVGAMFGALGGPRAASAEETSIAERSAAVQPRVRGGATGYFFVQLSSLRTEKRAQKELTELRDDHRLDLRNHNFTVQRADLGARGIYYRVLVGPYLSHFVASAYCSEVRSAGRDCMVLRREGGDSP